MVHGNTIDYTIQDLLEYAREVKGYDSQVPYYLFIMIKAARLPMGSKSGEFTNARKLINHCGEIGLDNDALKLPIIKLIKMNKLIDNFTDVRYSITDHPEVCMKGDKSDRDRIQGLMDSINVNEEVSLNERYIIEQVKAYFIRIVPYVPCGIFELPYTVDNIRYNMEKQLIDPINEDYVLFLHILNKVCHDCHYRLSSAVGFALQFNNGFSGSVCTTDNRPNMDDTQGIVTEAIKLLRQVYATVIRPCIQRNNDNNDAMAVLDALMGYNETCTVPIPEYIAIHGERDVYRIQDLLDYSATVEIEASLYFYIMIKATGITFRKAKIVIDKADLYKFDKKELRSAVMELIRENDLNSNFSGDEYQMRSPFAQLRLELPVDMDGEMSDRARIGQLTPVDARDTLSLQDVFVVDRFREYFQRTMHADLLGVFHLSYRADHIRYNIKRELCPFYGKRALFLLIIEKACNDCHYHLTDAVLFAKYFGTSFSNQILAANEYQDRQGEVETFLNNGTSTDFINDIRVEYDDKIKPLITDVGDEFGDVNNRLMELWNRHQ